MKRVQDNPPSRFPARPVAEARYPWWVAKVKPRQEKACAFDLLRGQIEYYLPLYTKVVRRRDNNKPRKSVLPLFPGYISFSQDVPEGIYTGGRIVSIIEVRNQRRFIDEMTQVYLALEAGAKLEPLRESYDPGTRVRVRRGPMRGIEGSIVQVRGEHLLVLSVEQFGRASVTIDSSLVEPMGR
jgi:transcription antitermination factor NusG